MQGGFITFEPFPEIVVVFILEVVDDAGPVEPRAAIISVDRIGQIEFSIYYAVGDGGFRR